MNECDPDTGIVAYMHCSLCLSECSNLHVAPSDYSRISVGTSPEGDLVVWCNRHNTLVIQLPNSEIAEELFKVASADCDCGRHGKETTH